MKKEKPARNGVPKTVYLDQETIDNATALGDGNFSKGLREAVKLAFMLKGGMK